MLLLFSLCQCSIDRTIIQVSEDEIQTLSEFRSLEEKHKTIISGVNEPGERLILCLTFVNKADTIPLVNQNVKFYHTSTNGNYEPTDANNDATARLNGEANTDANGRIFIETILPGDCGSGSDKRHIHTTVEGAHPEAYDIHFKQYTSFMGKRFNESSDQFFLVDLKTTADNKLVGFLTMEVKRPTTE